MNRPLRSPDAGRPPPGAWLDRAQQICRADLPSFAERPTTTTGCAGGGGGGYAARTARATAARASVTTSGAGVIGLVGGDVPREPVLAAGLLPVDLDPALLAADCHDLPPGLQLADPAAAVCSAILAGRLAGLDGLVVGRGSDCFVKLFHVLRELARRGRAGLPALHFHDRLVLASPSADAYNRRRLSELVATLATWSGRRVGDAELVSAIAQRNAVAAAVRSVDRLRRGNEPSMLASEVLALAGAARRLPPIEACNLLDEALRGRSPSAPPAPPSQPQPSQPQPSQPRPRPGALRLVLSGSDHDHLALYDELESSGALVVGEDHGWGARVWALDADESGEPLSALLERDGRLAPAPARGGIAGRVQDVLATLARDRGSAILQLVVGDDEAPGWETPALAAAAGQAGAGFATVRLPWPGRPAADAADALLSLLDAAAARCHAAVSRHGDG
ncbi:MAG TPA: 2-hydroxyacyl-CoA dehydratase family protein [Acidimicrobiales bacterium]|nr:2-hydroxyacyl-CoA dehydratase family protein [Acidimicrobiales bacterium]